MGACLAVLAFGAIAASTAAGCGAEHGGGGGGGGDGSGGCVVGARTYEAGDYVVEEPCCVESCLCGDDGRVTCLGTCKGATCKYAGKTYRPGDRFPASDGCNKCICGDMCDIECTDVACETACRYEGETYEIGASFPAGDGCNECTCVDGIGVVCTEHEPGVAFQSGTGCEICTCDGGGKVACHATGCPVWCEHGGPLYLPGDQVPAGDGCSTCECSPEGGFMCSSEGCPCDPEREHGRDYASLDHAACGDLEITCPDNTSRFDNDCGCGCRQALWCPASFDCTAESGNDCRPGELQALCPYSDIAL